MLAGLWILTNSGFAPLFRPLRYIHLLYVVIAGTTVFVMDLIFFRLQVATTGFFAGITHAGLSHMRENCETVCLV